MSPVAGAFNVRLRATLRAFVDPSPHLPRDLYRHNLQTALELISKFIKPGTLGHAMSVLRKAAALPPDAPPRQSLQQTALYTDPSFELHPPATWADHPLVITGGLLDDARAALAAPPPPPPIAVSSPLSACRLSRVLPPPGAGSGSTGAGTAPTGASNGPTDAGSGPTAAPSASAPGTFVPPHLPLGLGVGSPTPSRTRITQLETLAAARQALLQPRPRLDVHQL